MIVSYKYRAYPDATTEARLNVALDTCRWLYNTLLEECNTARENGSSLTMQETQARIVTLKEENPFLKDVYSKVLQMVNYTLWGNIRALSQTKKKGRKIGKLRFKSASRTGRSITISPGSRSTRNTRKLPSRRSERSVHHAPAIPGRGERCSDHPLR